MDRLFEMPEVRHTSKKSDEWFTPRSYIEAACEVMGGIDLDPASCAEANETVQAARYYTQEDNGLLRTWYGKVWLNPPYSKIDNKSTIEAFVNKLVAEYECGNIEQAILLATVRTEAAWYRPLWNYLICFPDHIIHFYKPSGKALPEKDSRHGHFFGTSFTYLGPHEAKFTEVFGQFCPVVKRVSPPPAKPATRTLWNDTSLLTNEIASWEVPGEREEEEQVG